MDQEGPASWELEAFPTSGAVDCHLSTLTGKHYGSPLNQLNLGHRTTMPVLVEAGGGGGRGSYTSPSLRVPLGLDLLCLENLGPVSLYLELERKRGA